jgi:lipopolysaccharide/colanic/teichoic acid biosynthesis glycosyltransferase
MDIYNTREELDAEKKKHEAKYGIQIKNEEQYFQMLKEKRCSNLYYSIVLLILMCILMLIIGFVFGTIFTYGLIKRMTLTNVSSFLVLH